MQQNSLKLRLSFLFSIFSFVEWTHEVLSSDSDDTLSHFRLLGAVEALASIFKVCSCPEINSCTTEGLSTQKKELYRSSFNIFELVATK